MHFRICLFVLISISGLHAKPFLLSVPRALSNFVSSASSSVSSYVFSAPQSLTSAEPAISDLRQSQKKVDDGDDFFKDEPSDFPVQNATAATTPSSLLQLKIEKILEKLRLLSQLSGPASPSSSDDDFQKEQDEFDKEFEEDTKNKNKGTSEDVKTSASLISGSGYFYPKPANPWESSIDVKKSEKLSETGRLFSFNPESFGVYLMEIVGSLVGLVYGAAAQLNAPSGVTNPP